MTGIENLFATNEVVYITDINASFLNSSITVLFCKGTGHPKVDLQLIFSDVENYKFSACEHDFSFESIEFLINIEEVNNGFLIKTSAYEFVITTNSEPLLEEISWANT